MRVTSRSTHRRAWLAAAFGVSAFAAASCERSLEGAPCPCVDGYTCCEPEHRCYASESSCRSEAESGGASGSAGMATGAAAGSVQSGGSGGSGGSGEETGGLGGSASGFGGSANGGTGSTENGGTSGIGEAGNGASAGTGGAAGSGGDGTVDPPPSHAKLPRFCSKQGWCGERQPLRAVWGYDGLGGANDVWVVGKSEAELGDTAFLHWNGHRWTNTPNDFVPGATVNAVWGTSPDNVWFVGGDGNGDATAFSWGGAAWSLPWTIPGIRELRAVAGLSINQVWAVGAQGGMAQWNGVAWSPIASGVTTDLNAIWQVGFDLYAVGAAGTVLLWAGQGTGDPLIDVKVVADDDLNAVWGRAVDDVWVAGNAATLLHHDGNGWSAVNVDDLVGPTVDFVTMTGDPNGFGTIWLTASDGSLLYLEDDEWQRAPVQATHRLNGVWPAPNGELWAVGDAGSSVHFDGEEWSTSPEPVTADLFGVWASAANDVWAVGRDGTVLHWNGNAWTRVSEPETQGNWAAVTGTSSSDVWLVGERIIHFDGSDWSIQRDEGSAMLRSVCAVTTNDAWAVGDGGVILYWNGTEWSPSETFPEMNLKTVWCGATDNVWAIDVLDGVLYWDGQSWTEVTLPGESDEVPLAQALTGSTPDDVWVLSTFENTGGGWLRTNRRDGQGRWTPFESGWSSPILAAHAAELGKPVEPDKLWLVGAGIWLAMGEDYFGESYPDLGATLHDIWAPREPTPCDEDLGATDDLTGPSGAWAVGSSGTLLEKQCIRVVGSVIID